MERIKFKYKFDESYNPHYVTGAFGGVTGRGEMVINFYMERMALPVNHSHNIINGELELPGEIEPENIHETRIRFIDTGVIMNLITAKELHAWLGERIKIMEDALLQDSK